MNLLCPNCQKMLTVPEQYAGQLMKCPLCNGTFTVPALPSAPTAPPPTAPPSPGPDIFNFKEPLPPAPPTSAPSSTTAPSMQPSAPAPPPPPPPPLPPGEYTRKASIWFSPKVLQFVPAVAVVLLFILQFVPWVGVSFGSYALVTQNAWGGMIGTKPDEENDTKRLFQWTNDKDLEKYVKDRYTNSKDGRDDSRTLFAYAPSWSPVQLLYLLLFFPTAALTVACVVLPYVPVKLPPVVQTLLRWKWAIALLLNLLLFFLLVLQLAMGFGIESSVKIAQKDRQAFLDKARDEAKDTSVIPKLEKDAALSDAVSHVQYTTWVCVVVVLHILVIIGALLMFWLNQRETFNKPLPELILRW